MTTAANLKTYDGDFYRKLLAAVLCMLILSGCYQSEVRKIDTLHFKLDSIEQVIPISDSLVVPILYTNVSGLDSLPLSQARKKFIDVMLPAILVARHKVEMERVRLMEICHRDWTSADSLFVSELGRRYNAKDADELLVKIGTIPTSIVLAQAAVESAWGRSRFFIQASNVFGIWSTDTTKARIPASIRRGNKVIYLRSYNDISLSVNDYFEVLSRANSYRGLRKARRSTQDPFKLVPYFRLYSERKGGYTQLLSKIIRQNNLTQYDHFVIHPHYVVRE